MSFVITGIIWKPKGKSIYCRNVAESIYAAQMYVDDAIEKGFSQVVAKEDDGKTYNQKELDEIIAGKAVAKVPPPEAE